MPEEPPLTPLVLSPAHQPRKAVVESPFLDTEMHYPGKIAMLLELIGVVSGGGF